jgi:hypothetical protein
MDVVYLDYEIQQNNVVVVVFATNGMTQKNTLDITMTPRTSSAPKVKGGDIRTPHVSHHKFCMFFCSVHCLVKKCNCYLDTSALDYELFLKGRFPWLMVQ